MTGAGDRDAAALPPQPEARIERYLLSPASLPQVRSPLERESGSGRDTAIPVTTAQRLYRLRANSGGSLACDLLAHRELRQSVAVPCVQELLADLCRCHEQH